ncbi:MAG: hypothetical protein ABI647_05765 [Gemmatimonadota bacterium]
MSRFGWLALLATLGCGGAASDHERLGDEAYGKGSFPKALAEYRAAERGGARRGIWAKVAASAFHNRDFSGAIDAYRQLATDDPTRASEAATGLERIARAAERAGAGEVPTLARAILALRAVAPGRPLGRLALHPAGVPNLERADLLGLVPAALASAAGPRSVDSLLLTYADAQRLTTACDAAARSYRTVLRRTDDARQRTMARDGLASCALQLGLDALAAQAPGEAEQWFETALGVAAGSPRGLRAQIGLGEARLAQGDLLGASIAFQAVLSAAGAPDSLQALATQKLNALGAAGDAPPPETRS